MPDNENLEVVGDEPQYEYVTDPMMLDSTGQDIVDKLDAIAGAISPAASNVTFNNTGTGMTASNVQAGIEEVASVTTKLHYASRSITSDANGYATLPIAVSNTFLLSGIANGILTIPMDGGEGYWVLKYINPSNMQPYPNLSRTIKYYYIDL